MSGRLFLHCKLEGDDSPYPKNKSADRVVDGSCGMESVSGHSPYHVAMRVFQSDAGNILYENTNEQQEDKR